MTSFSLSKLTKTSANTPLKAAIMHSKKLHPMFVVAINDIFLLTLCIKRTSVGLAFWGGLARVTGDTYVNRLKERSY